MDVNQPYATFNITKGTDAPQSVGSPGDAQKPISDDGLTPVAAAAKLSSSDTPEIIKMLVKHGMIRYLPMSVWQCWLRHRKSVLHRLF